MEVISESEFREICKGLWCKGWRKAASAPRARQEVVRTTSPLLAPTATSAVANICTEEQEILVRLKHQIEELDVVGHREREAFLQPLINLGNHSNGYNIVHESLQHFNREGADV